MAVQNVMGSGSWVDVLPRRSSGRAAALQEIRALVALLDNCYTIPGTNLRVGWDAIIGLVPGIGDVATTLLASYIIYRARELGVSKYVLTRMALNVAIDAMAGVVPVVGDVLDVAWKANMKNLQLLERHLNKMDDAGLAVK